MMALRAAASRRRCSTASRFAALSVSRRSAAARPAASLLALLLKIPTILPS
jgi:hypothetical protein